MSYFFTQNTTMTETGFWILHKIRYSLNKVVEYTYDPYGNIITQTNSAVADANPYRYRGYRYDEETGFYYLNSRYYNPRTGRFLNADGMLKASGSVLGHNMFAYTSNNPIMYVDPSGFCAFANIDDMQQEGHDTGCGGVPLSNGYIGTGWSSLGNEDVVIFIDFSFTMLGVEGGHSIVMNITDKYIEYYPHIGVCINCTLSLNFGIIDNYDDPGDYRGLFTTISASNGVGFAHSWTPESFIPFDPYDEDDARAYSVNLSPQGVSGSISYYAWNEDRQIIIFWGEKE